ncbi:MAG: hypothetical protein H7842_01175 [Gammaproteobacteria bacterium SHHR-1]|uniref:hypothetical protein n=1 Tax=Magnetovirga frankeli TaxID=947516 RepID=UPI0012937D16|nr:hypothetical protein D5125_09075 [gamma proteobacterium SS-5]
MSQMRKMGPETWIMLVTLLFILVLAVLALSPEERPKAVTKGVTLANPATGMTAAWNSNPARANNAAALQPVQPITTYPYNGVVDQFVNRDPKGWGQVHILVNDGAGLIQDVSLAPEWYLSFQGCVIRRGLHVEGVGFHFDGVTQGGRLYAKNVIVNGVRCRLRTDQGLALWTDQIR